MQSAADAYLRRGRVLALLLAGAVGAPAAAPMRTGQAPATATALALHVIQGPAARSPVEGWIVVTSGVVTARKSNGLFLQSPDGAADADPRTSEGLFVFTGSGPAANLTPGTLVQVTGRVIEFVPAADPASPPLTEIGEGPVFEVRGAGMTLPAPVEIQAGDLSAQGGHGQLEQLEGMRVRVAVLTAVSPTLGTVNEANATATSSGVFYGVLPEAGRPFREPGIDLRQALPAGAPCCVPRFDGNPERLRIDSDAQPGAPALNVASGAVVRNLVGPLDYGLRAYTLLPDPGAPSVTPAGEVSVVRPAADDEFVVASFNLQRFFDTTDDPGVSDAVLTSAAYQLRLRKASLYIRRLMLLPVILGVQEVENLATLQALAATLNREARDARELKPRYQAFLEEGNDPGGIDVGFLVDTARVEVLQVAQEGLGTVFRSPTSGQLERLNDRPPLVLRARATFPNDARPLTVVVNHLRSLIDIDSPTSGPRVRAKRAAQAEFLAELVNRRLAADQSERILVLGDFNAGTFSDGYVDVLGTVRGAPTPRDRVVVATRDLLDPDLTDLGALAVASERYSYVFDGSAEALDHLLASDALLPFVTAMARPRGNADAPETWRSDGGRPERISDHDPALVYISVRDQ